MFSKSIRIIGVFLVLYTYKEFWNTLIVDICKDFIFGIYELTVLFGNRGQQYYVLLLFSSATPCII
jgi:hypothetical protein